MGKSFRVRTDVRRSGEKDKNVTFELNQDFDLLEILSLSLTQQDVYTRMCADFGVVVGRVITNGGFGIPNAKVSIFIPLTDEDEENGVIKQLYPFKEPFDVNENGQRYNLLSSEPNFDCHVSVGSFPTLNDVLNKQDVKYVYDKYYKYTVKTNESGDFMIYGVPVGDHTIIMDVDVSDIGCFSLLPEDFKIKGFPDSDFDGAKFKTDQVIDSLPQILSQQKSIDVRPFWGDEEFCRAAITRVDFDLSVNGFKLEPNAVFMGSTASDTDKDSVNRNCRPKAAMGELCSLISKPGIIDCIRYTPFFKNDPNAYPAHTNGGWGAPLGGEVPILERFYLPNGGRVIDDTGSFLVHIPMNMDYMTTNEFGEMVLSEDPSVGVPTRARCRFRIRPEQATGGARQRRIGSYLVPNIREFTQDIDPNGDEQGDWPGIDPSTYAFSVEYSDYNPWAQRNLMPGAKDVFYDMTFNRVYTYSQFHDHIKHGGRRQFVGIKNILPEADQQCSTTAMFFPINSAVRAPSLMVFLWMFLIDFLGMIYMFLNILVSTLALFLSLILGVILFIMWVLCWLWCAIYCIHISIWGFTILDMASLLGPAAAPPDECGQICISGGNCFGCGTDCRYFGLRMGFVLFTLRQTKYPECEKCMCRTMGDMAVTDSLIYLASQWPCPGGLPGGPSATTTSTGSSCVPQCPPGNGATGDDFGGTWQHDCCQATDETRICCPDHYGFRSDDINDPSTSGTPNDGVAGGGCYVKLICFSPACVGPNYNMRVLLEWTRREKIAQALCNGIMNYFWENSWVNGFLYQFQFRAKIEYDPVNDTYAGPQTKYCKKLAYLHPTEHAFYYRSTPFKVTGIGINQGSFIGDDDGVYNPWWAFAGSSGSNHAKGDMERHILFPTTMIDMGSRNQCIQQICLDPNYSNECSVTDQIGSTTFQDITELVSDAYNLKMQHPRATMSTFFPRPEYEIGGDVAQALMQNCMLGVAGYEANVGTTACECDFNNGISQSPGNQPPVSGLTYPSPNFVGGTYVQHALNVNDINNTNNFRHILLWEPQLFTASTQVIMDGQDLIDCVTMELSASSQYIPFYPWHLHNASGTLGGQPIGGFGTVWNDWLGTLGEFRYAYGIPGPAMSILPAIDSDTAEGATLHPTPANAPYVSDGNYQHYMGNPPFTFAGNNYPLLTGVIPDSRSVVFSQPLFYYFGLRPGATSFNTFVRKYIDEELADTVI